MHKNYFTFAPLKKTAAILFLSIYLLSTLALQELLKLPVVFQHYSEHQQEDKTISFARFLAIHYLHGSPRDKDYDRDMQLPFKTMGNGIASIAIPFVSFITAFILTRPVEVIKKKNYVILEQSILPSYPASIWQPPRAI